MKDIPVWVRRNGQELVRLEPSAYPRVVYYVRKRRELGLTHALGAALGRLKGLLTPAAAGLLKRG